MLPVRPHAFGFDHPEDLAFDSAGALWTGGELGQVYRLDPGAEAPVEVVRHGGETRGIAFDSDGRAIVCNHALSTVFRVWPDGRSEELPCVAGGRRIDTPNYAAFGRDGSLFVSDSWRFPEPDGYIYLWPPGGGEPEIFHSGPFGYPNGLAVDAAGDWLYVIETGHDAIVRVPTDRAEGAIERVAGGLSRMPDGMAFDAEGRLYVAHFGAGRVDVFDGNGREVDRIRVPGREVTNIAFGGLGYDELVITECATASIYRVRVGVRGLQLFGGLRAGTASTYRPTDVRRRT